MLPKSVSGRSLFADLSRSIALRTFVCFVAIEIVVLLPSYHRQKQQLAEASITATTAALQPWIGLSDSALQPEIRRNILERIISNSTLLGLEIYTISGQKIWALGEESSSSLREWQLRPTRRIYNSAQKNYEALIVPETLEADYFVIAKYDSILLNRELTAYVWRIVGLILLIGAIVTLGILLTLRPKVLKPLYQLRRELLLVTEAISQDREQPQMMSTYIPNDELGDVIHSFHGFVSEIYTAISDRKEVEVELTSINQTLQTEIQRRKVIEGSLKTLNDQLQSLADSDGLTCIANRRYFDETIDREWRRMARLKVPISLIILDVDCFKQFNDHYGHPAGDDCLIKIAQASQSEIKRPGDLLARYGGEEFVVILPHTDLEGAKVVADNIRHAILALKIPHKYSAASSCVTVSMGIATQIPPPRTQPQALIEAADQALYQAKKQGRNQFCCASIVSQA